MKEAVISLMVSLLTSVTWVLARPQSARVEIAMSNKEWADVTDAAKAAQAKAVLRVKLIKAEGGDKYSWDKVQVLHVIKNQSSFQFPGELEIAHYSWEPGIPAGTSTVYLEPYSAPSDNRWKLLSGSAKQGVSHKA
jgi:hypothetical protein